MPSAEDIGPVPEGSKPDTRRQPDRSDSRIRRLPPLCVAAAGRGRDAAPSSEQLSAAVAAPGTVHDRLAGGRQAGVVPDRFRACADVYAVRWENARTGYFRADARRRRRLAPGHGPPRPARRLNRRQSEPTRRVWPTGAWLAAAESR